MKTMRKLMLLALLVLACSCTAEEDGDWDDDYQTPSTSSGGGWGSSYNNGCDNLFTLLGNFGNCLAISWFTALGAYVDPNSVSTTSDPETTLGGSAFVSPDDSTCCPAEAGVTVEWTNETTGESGTATSTLSATSSGSPETWSHEWQAKVRLQPGQNRITVAAFDRSGNWAKRSVAVTREP